MCTCSHTYIDDDDVEKYKTYGNFYTYRKCKFAKTHPYYYMQNENTISIVSQEFSIIFMIKLSFLSINIRSYRSNKRCAFYVCVLNHHLLVKNNCLVSHRHIILKFLPQDINGDLVELCTFQNENEYIKFIFMGKTCPHPSIEKLAFYGFSRSFLPFIHTCSHVHVICNVVTTSILVNEIFEILLNENAIKFYYWRMAFNVYFL